jgi:hypothetical protein
MFDRDRSAFIAILEANMIFPGVTQSVIKEKINAQSKAIESAQHNLMIDNQVLASDVIIGRNPDLSTLSEEHLEACQLAQTLHAERLSLDNPAHKADIDFALNIVRDPQSVIHSSEKNAIKYLEMLSANSRLNYQSNQNFNSKTDLLSTALSGGAILSTLNPIAKITSATISGAILAKGIKRDNNEPGITPVQWEKIPLEFRNRKTFKAAVLTNEKIELQDKVHKKLFSSYIEKNDELLETNVEMTQSIVNYINTMKSSQTIPDSKPTSGPRQISNIDIVMLHSLGNIESSLDTLKKELKEVKNQKKFQENLRGFQQSIHTLHQFGTAFKSQQLQKTAEVLNQTLNLTIGFSQLTNTMPALLEMAAGIGSVLGPVGMVASAALSLVSLFGKKKKQENTFPRIMVEYLQTICKQIYYLHKTVIEGFSILENNQHKQMKMMLESVKHLDILIRAEAHHTRMAITDLSHHLDSSMEQLIEHITESNKELHVQSLKELMDTVDFYIAEKENISTKKVKEVAHKLISWIKPSTNFSASSLHTGGVNLSSLRNEIYLPITNRLAGADSSQKVVMKNIGLLGSLLSELKIPLEHKEEALDVSSLPYPPLWFKVVNKYIAFREHFPDVLIDKESLIHIENSKNNMSLFVELLQNKEEIYTNLLDSYESALNTIVSIVNQATQAKNKEINCKLLNIDSKEYKEEKNIFDISKNLNQQLAQIEDYLFDQPVRGKNLVTGGFSLPTSYELSLPFASEAWSLSSLPIPIKDFKTVFSANELNPTIRDLIFLSRTNILPAKFTYGITQTKSNGLAMADLNLNIEFVDDNKKILETMADSDIHMNFINGSKKILGIKYVINGDNKLKTLYSNVNCTGFNFKQPWTLTLGFSFDNDFSNVIGSIVCKGSQGLYLSVNNSKLDDLKKIYNNKKIFHTLELDSDFKQIQTTINTALNNYVLKEKKDIIKNIYGATLGRAKEIYQELLKKALVELDFYLSLLKAYTSLAGLTSSEEQKISINPSTLPESIKNLPDSNYIENELKNYLDIATVSQEWPMTHLITRVKPARDDIASAIRSTEEFPKAIFLSPLQIQLAIYMAPVHLMLELLEQEKHVVKVVQFTKEERELISSKLGDYQDYYDLYKDWIQDVKEDNKYHLKLNQYLQKASSDLKIIEKTMTDKIFSVHICPGLNELHKTFIQLHNGLATCFKGQFILTLENISGNGSDFQKLCRKYEKYNHQVTVNKDVHITSTEDLEQKRLPVNPVFRPSSPISPARASNSGPPLSFASNIPIVSSGLFKVTQIITISTSESKSETHSDKKNERDPSITYRQKR